MQCGWPILTDRRTLSWYTVTTLDLHAYVAQLIPVDTHRCGLLDGT